MAKLSSGLNSRVSEIDKLLIVLEFERFPETKYVQPKSNAKYLFKIPSERYLTDLMGCKINNYDKIIKVRINCPHIPQTPQNKKIEMTEKIYNGSYYCYQNFFDT